MATNPANAPTRGSRLDRFANSPRAQRRFAWISAAVLVTGIAAFVLVFVLHDKTVPQSPVTRGPIQKTVIPAHVKPSKDAFKVAREFLETAVARTDLHEAYTLVAAPLKAGESRKEWESGTNPVIPFHAKNARTAGLDVLTSTKNSLYLALTLVPTAAAWKSGERPDSFYMELQKQKDGKWLVDYFEAQNPYGVPAGGGNG
jgi:hypothetical protein